MCGPENEGVVVVVRGRPRGSPTETDGFSFPCGLSGRLEIVLTEQPKKITEGLANVAATAAAQIQSLHPRWGIFEDHERRELDETEWAQVALRASSLRMNRDGAYIVLWGS